MSLRIKEGEADELDPFEVQLILGVNVIEEGVVGALQDLDLWPGHTQEAYNVIIQRLRP